MTVARVSQVAAEALVTPTDQLGRVSQVAAEALVTPTDGKVRVSQLALEVLVTPTSATLGLRARVSQLALETLVSSWGRAVVSQLALEALVTENVLPPPPPPGPLPPPVTGPVQVQRLYWRDAHGHVHDTYYYLDLDTYGGDLDALAADAQSLASLIDLLVHGYLEQATGPYYFQGLLAYGASASGATVSDVVDVAAATAAGEVTYLRLPTTPWTAANAGLLGNLGSVPALLDVVTFWLTHCCSPIGGPLVLYVGTYRRRAEPPVKLDRKTRRPDLGGQGL